MKELKRPIEVVEEENENLRRSLHNTQRLLVDTVARMAVEEYKRKEELIASHKEEMQLALEKNTPITDYFEMERLVKELKKHLATFDLKLGDSTISISNDGVNIQSSQIVLDGEGEEE